MRNCSRVSSGSLPTAAPDVSWRASAKRPSARRKDPEGTFNILIAAGTTSGDTIVADGDISRLMKFLRSRPMLVHVLIYSGPLNTNLSGGIAQTEVGSAVSQGTRGRYEVIDNMPRYVTLLTELGET